MLQLNWVQSQSTVKPDETQFVNDGVLLHRNITESVIEDVTYYDYEEARLTTGEYAQKVAEQNQANIDYLAMELEVDL